MWAAKMILSSFFLQKYLFLTVNIIVCLYINTLDITGKHLYSLTIIFSGYGQFSWQLALLLTTLDELKIFYHLLTDQTVDICVLSETWTKEEKHYNTQKNFLLMVTSVY